jgi:hypothetical protein
VRFGEQSAADVAPCGLAGLAAPACVLGTMRGRSGLAGANTPWYRVRWARGLGTSALGEKGSSGDLVAIPTVGAG